MIRNNLTPIGFFDSAQELTYEKKTCPLFSPKNTFLPFQVRTHVEGIDQYSSISISVYSNSSGTYTDCTSQVSPHIRSFLDPVDNKLVIVFDGSGIGLNLDPGAYMLRVTVNNWNYYSDYFTVVNDIQNFLKVSWQNAKDFPTPSGTIFYTAGGMDYKNVMYFPTGIGMPEYEFIEDTEKRSGYYFLKKQVSRKAYRFVAVCREEMCDALMYARMSDFVTIELGQDKYEVEEIEFQTEWQTQGYFVSVNAKFYTDTLAKRVGETVTSWSALGLTGIKTQPNNNFSALPFYQSIIGQFRNRPETFGQDFPLFVPVNHAPTFQIMVPTISPRFLSVEVFREDGTSIGDRTAAFIQAGLTTTTFASAGLDIIWYPDTSEVFNLFGEGKYYLKLTTNDYTFYSEVFTMVKSISGNGYDYSYIKWDLFSNLVMDGGILLNESVGHIVNKYYFAGGLGSPDYEFEVEGETVDGVFSPISRTMNKVFHLSVLAPEYLCDVFRFIMLSDLVEVKSGNTKEAMHIKWSASWQEQGALAAVNFDIEFDYVSGKIGKFTGVISRVLQTEAGEDLLTDYSPAQGEIGLEIII